MLAQDNNELLIPPVVTMPSVTPPPPPSDPPTQLDVDRALLYKNMVESSLSVARCHATAEDVASAATYYVRVRQRYEQSLVREFRQYFHDLNDKIDRMDRRITTMDRRITTMDQRISGGHYKRTGAKFCGRNGFNVADFEAASNQLNRERSRGNRPGTEVPFLDGVIPSSRRHSAVKSAADIDRLTGREARTFAAGHGFGELQGTDNIKDRLKIALGFVEE
ncbi:hypothetical protein V1520DRAFT_327878 [Lipomyces starkeyi]